MIATEYQRNTLKYESGSTSVTERSNLTFHCMLPFCSTELGNNT